MPEATELVGRLVRIAGKIGIIAGCNYSEDADTWSLNVRLMDGEEFISFPPNIYPFLI